MNDESRIRPINPLRDLDELAGLIELVLGSEIERWGGDFRAQMRMAKVMAPWFKFLGFFSENYRHTFDGYLWEEGGRLIAAVILQPVLYDLGRWQIMNVVTDPEFRRRGIARKLVTKAIEHARSNGARICYLEVQQQALPAIKLYQDLGFSCYDRLTILKRTGNESSKWDESGNFQYSKMSMADWKQRFELAKLIAPAEVQEFMPVSQAEYQFSIWQQVFDPPIMRLQGIESTWWGAEKDQTLVGFANLVACKSPLMTNRITIEILPAYQNDLTGPFLDMVLDKLQKHPQQVTMTMLNHSSHETLTVYQEHKFEVMEEYLRMGLKT